MTSCWSSRKLLTSNDTSGFARSKSSHLQVTKMGWNKRPRLGWLEFEHAVSTWRWCVGCFSFTGFQKKKLPGPARCFFPITKKTNAADISFSVGSTCTDNHEHQKTPGTCGLRSFFSSFGAIYLSAEFFKPSGPILAPQTRRIHLPFEDPDPQLKPGDPHGSTNFSLLGSQEFVGNYLRLFVLGFLHQPRHRHRVGISHLAEMMLSSFLLGVSWKIPVMPGP